MKIRLMWADSLKGWLMILVVIGHAIQSFLHEECHNDHVWNLIYSFHMPAFMAVSGWLNYRIGSTSKLVNCDLKVYLNNCKRRSFQLLVPYFVWSLIQFIRLEDYSIQNLSKMIFYPDAYLWFLWVLFWICVLFNLAQLIASKCKINEMIPIGGFCIILMIFMVGLEFRMFGFQFLAYYFLFYTIGYCLHKYEIKLLCQWKCLVPLFCLWLILAWGWTMHGLPSWMPVIPNVPSALLQYAYRGFTAFVAIVFLIGVAPMILNGTGQLNIFISRVGVVSLGMYAGHLVFLGYVKNLFLQAFPELNIWCGIAVTSVFTFIIAYLMIRLIEKNKYTARIFLGKI
ncbi:MAG: acyltransferase family protein [Paludibacteraceae bacterium]|jgi:fucose 4-O-acetylase-like acetyltransferase|nr:acyltransferase family protein [Paludibacteraceae bacterium]